MNTKICYSCKLEKPISDFSVSAVYKDGYRGQCKVCRRSYTNKYRAETGYKYKAKRKVTQKQGRAKRLMENYRLKLSAFEAMATAQNHRCAICKIEAVETRLKILCVDHCHSSGRIRGLLCDLCNRGLGLMRDDTQVLQNAISYLSR